MNIQREIKQTKPFVTAREEATVALIRTGDLVRRAVAAIVEPHGITVQQYNVLRILRGAGKRGLPTLDIAERMVEQTPGITRLIDRLESKKLVARERCKTDRRQVFCQITAAGLQLLAGLDQPLRDAEELALAALTERQLTQLMNLLDLARNGLHASIESSRAELTEEAS
jgi:MarR family transcriptional regulator, organic hydroperoxide resistance regulator